MPNQSATPGLDAFINDLRVVAAKHGIRTLVIAGVDPRTRQAHVYGAPDALAMLKPAIVARLGIAEAGEDEAETAWPSG